MTTELRTRNPAQQIYISALSSAWRNGFQLYDPSVWQMREPEIEEKMLRDADIAHAVGFRRHLIAGKDWKIAPKLETPRSPLAVMVGTELVGAIKHFTTVRQNLARAFLSGSRFGRIHGNMRRLTLGDGKERTWWVPFRVEDIDKRRYRIVPEHEKDNVRAHWERWDVAQAKFIPESIQDAICTIRHVYQDDEASLGYGRGLRDALGWWWYAKTHVMEETLSAIERFAQGVLKARVNGIRDADTKLPNSEKLRAWIEVLENMRARHVIVHDEDDDIEMMPVSGEGWQLLQDIRNDLRSTIFTLVLGANLTTSANEGGSYALAEVQENSTEALVQFDRETLEETLTDDLVGAVWKMNHANLVELGIAEEQPTFSMTQEKKQDPVERSQVAQTLNAMGVELSLEDVLEQTGFRKPEPGEALVRQAMAGGFSLGGFGGLGIDPAPAPDQAAPAPSAEAPSEAQDTALNGAQVVAAAEIIDRVVNKQMPPGTALRMLTSMFNLPEKEARAMIDEAAAFQPTTPPAPQPEAGAFRRSKKGDRTPALPF